jgi:prolyl-tRNA synthetase
LNHLFYNFKVTHIQSCSGGRNEAEALPPKEADFGAWYSTVVVKSELLSYYDIPGLYVLRPSAYGLWEAIQRWFDAKIKSVGVENCMFPLFITKDVLEQEKEHVEVHS